MEGRIILRGLCICIAGGHYRKNFGAKLNEDVSLLIRVGGIGLFLK